MIDAVIEQFLTYLRLELNRSQLTVASYRSDLSQFERFVSGDERLDLRSVTINDVRAWIVHRSSVGDCSRSLRRKLQAVRALYRWLMRRGVVDDNPAADVELARLPKPLPHMLRQQNLDKLLDAPVDTSDFEQVRDHLILLMLYSTGLRRAELIDLRDSAVDAAACQLRVRGKRDKDRIVPFGHELAMWIGIYRSVKEREVGSTELFFVRLDGRPLYPTLVYRVVHDALQHVGGGEKFSPHVLRHTFASAMLNDGADITSVKELLGHESLAATQVYTHITLSELKNLYKHAHPRALKKGG